MNQILKAFLCCSLFAVFLAGCEEASESEIRRAKLVGNENIQLKKQLELKDKEIQKFKDLVAKCEEDMALALQQSGEANLKVLKVLAETSKENDTLKEENLSLKAQIEELKASGASK